jgi:hypothetical protein
MNWQPSDENCALFEPSKQRSAAYTLERRKLRTAMLSFAESLGGSWDCTPAEPCLANRRQVQNLVLFSAPDRVDGERNNIDLSSPFALDLLPFHEHLSCFVQIDKSALSWGMILHRKAQLDERNLKAFCGAFEGEQALQSLLDALPDARAQIDVENPVNQSVSASELMPKTLGKGWCIWWYSKELDESLPEQISKGLERLQPLIKTLRWTADNDLCGALAEHKAVRQEQAKSRFREGDRVRIIAGLFAGRIGRVEKRHEKGGVSLGIGPITIQLKDDEISPL